MSFLSRFKVILLDMNGTFMFGQDRFGPGECFGATYRHLGGTKLADTEVERAVRTTYEAIAADYDNPNKYDDFPQVADVIHSLHPALSSDERRLIEEVIAIHELGHVPDAYAACLRRLARTHRLGLVANIWCRKDRWLRELKRTGVLDLFETLVFSSDHKSMKPSSVLFDLAFRPFGVGKDDAVFVGDSWVHDIEGAKRFGISAVWINPEGTGAPAADLVVRDLCGLANGGLSWE